MQNQKDPYKSCHEGAVINLAFSPDGTLLATVGQDSKVILWSLKDRAPLLTLPRHQRAVNAVAFSQDGKQLVSGSSDGVVRVWDVSPDRVAKLKKLLEEVEKERQSGRAEFSQDIMGKINEFVKHQ